MDCLGSDYVVPQQRRGVTIELRFLHGPCRVYITIACWYPEFHVVMHASHAALPLVMSKFRPNVALPMLGQMSP
jgi:hypothetical protein